jgi:hypothetical protein
MAFLPLVNLWQGQVFVWRKRRQTPSLAAGKAPAQKSFARNDDTRFGNGSSMLQ